MDASRKIEGFSKRDDPAADQKSNAMVRWLVANVFD